MRFRFMPLLLSFVWVAGCARTGRTPGDFVEYVDAGKLYGEPTRILLLPEGAARVDFAGDKSGRGPRAYLLPASPPEVRRLLRAVATIDERAIAEAVELAPAGEPPERAMTLTFRCRLTGRERVVEAAAGLASANHVVAGLVDELEVVGRVRLARAIDEARLAEEMASRGGDEWAARAYNWAVRGLLDWSDASCRRHGLVPERLPSLLPEVEGIVAYPIQLTAGAHARAARAMTRPGAERDGERARVATDALRHAWRELTTDLSITPEGDVTILSFPARAEPTLTHGIPEGSASIPPELVDVLRKATWKPTGPAGARHGPDGAR